MKKLMISLLLTGMLIIGGCSAKTTAEKKPDDTNTKKAETTETTQNTDDDTASEETDKEASIKIKPLASTIHLDNLEDSTLHVAFQPSNVSEESDGSITLKMEVYDYELFDLVDISKLKVGDTIVLSGENVKIDQLKNDGDVEINGGYMDAEGGHTLTTSDNTVYREVIDNDYPVYKKVGDVTLTLSDNFKFTDNSDLSADIKTFDAKGFVTEMADSDASYNELATTAVIENGKIAEIEVAYTP